MGVAYGARSPAGTTLSSSREASGLRDVGVQSQKHSVGGQRASAEVSLLLWRPRQVLLLTSWRLFTRAPKRLGVYGSHLERP
eukprot:2632797-Prymnesium_polylepis.1